MIGGEFDLSVGSTVGATGMIIVILSTQYGWNVWASFVVALIFAVLIGTLNGYLVLRTGLPSFIVTLGTNYILLGVTTGLTVLITGLTVVSGLDHAPGYSSAHAVFATSVSSQGFPIETTGRWRWSRWQRGSVRAPLSATGSSALAAMPMRCATPAYRSPG